MSGDKCGSRVECGVAERVGTTAACVDEFVDAVGVVVDVHSKGFGCQSKSLGRILAHVVNSKDNVLPRLIENSDKVKETSRSLRNVLTKATE